MNKAYAFSEGKVKSNSISVIYISFGKVGKSYV